MKVCVNMPSHVCIAAQAQGEFASRGHATKEPLSTYSSIDSLLYRI